MKLLLGVLCCIAAASALTFSSHGFEKELVKRDYALFFDDESVVVKVGGAIRERLQEFLNKIKEELGKHQDVFDAVKEKVAEIQGRIRNLVTVTGERLWEKALQIKDKIVQLGKTVLERIANKGEYALLPSFENIGSVLEQLGHRIEEGLQNIVENIKSKIAEHKDVFDAVKAKISDVQEMIREAAKQGISTLFQKATEIQEKLNLIIKEVLQRIQNKLGFSELGFSEYGLFDDSEDIFERVARLVYERLQNALDKIKEKLAQNKDIFDAVKEKIASVQKKITELIQSTGAKVIEKAGQIRTQLRELLKSIRAKLQQKEQEQINYALFETEVGGVLENLARRLREHLQNVLDNILERVEKYKDIALDIKGKVLDIKAKLQELAQASGTKMFEIARKIQNQLQDLLKITLAKINNKEIVEYSLIDFGDETLLEIFNRKVRQGLQATLDNVKKMLKKHDEIYESVKSKVQEIDKNINDLTNAVGWKIVTVADEIRQKLRALVKTVVGKIGGISDPIFYADESQLPGEFSRKRLQSHLDDLTKRVAKYADVQSKYQEQLAIVQARVNSVASLSGWELSLTSSRVLREIGALRNTILTEIGIRRPDKN